MIGLVLGRRMGRRSALRLAGGGVAAALGQGRAAVARSRPGPWAPRFAVYRFDATAEAGARSGGCAACRRHAAHKRFATRAAAEAHRAHPGCRCAILASPVPRATYVRIFGEPGGVGFRPVVDDRRPG